MSKNYKTMISRKIQPSKYDPENSSNTLTAMVKRNLNVMKARHKNLYIVIAVKNTMLQEQKITCSFYNYHSYYQKA